MASLGIAAKSALRGSLLNSLPTRTEFSSEAQGIRFSASTPSLPNRLAYSVTNGRSHRRISANAGQCVKRSANAAAKDSNQAAGSRGFPKLVESEIIALPAALEGNGITLEKHCQELLKRSGLADLLAREAFVIRGDITEANMDRLVESLVYDEGQTMEDYQQRAIIFGKIAEFFSQGKAYSVEDDSSTGASEIARNMHVIVDVVLAEEGRSATDYNCRAQLFAKSAEMFPFNAEVRSS